MTFRPLKNLTPILLLTLLFPSLALGGSLNDLVKTDGLYYEKFTGVPFTGKVTGVTQGTFKNGKRHGPWVTYWDPGELWSKGTYKDGKEDGPWVGYWFNGTVWDDYTGTFKNGVEVSD